MPRTRTLLILSIGLWSCLQVGAAADEGLELWAKIYEVFSHPRCTNCHVGAGELPLWSGPSYGAHARPHGMYISVTSSRDGGRALHCQSCHTASNSELPHGPPGAEVWALAPVENQFLHRASRELCEQIKDPARNGQRTLDELADHLDHDPLVSWAWAPGGSREPPPYSKDDLVIFLWDWDEAGAPCPDS